MIDWEKQSTFSGELSHYSVTLAMREKQLTINVLDNETLHKFYGCISQQFIDSQDRFFCGYFECPEDVFTHLTKHFEETVIENGILRFKFTSGVKSQVRQTTIELLKEEVDDNSLTHLKMDKMKEYFTTQIQQKEKRIADLQDIVKELSQQFRKHKKECQQKMRIIQEKIQKQQNYSKKLEEKIQNEQYYVRRMEIRIQKQVQTLENYSKTLEGRIQMQEKNNLTLKERLQKQENSTISPEEKMQKAVKFIGILNQTAPQPISHHPKNPHQQYFSICTLTNCTATSAILTKTGGGSNYYNFVNGTEVLPKQHNKYAIKMLKMYDMAIGFCTEKGLGKDNNYNKDESVYYGCNCTNVNGNLWENGTCKALSGCGSVDGDSMEVFLDLLEWRACWKKNGKVLVECTVPESMKGRSIYFSICVMNEGNKVEVTSL